MMRKNTKVFCWFLFILGVFFFLLPGPTFSSSSLGGQSLEEKNEIKATVHIEVTWNNHDEYNGNLEDTGRMSAFVTGTLVKQRKGLLAFFPGDDGMQAIVEYQNERKDKKTGEFYSREEGSGSIQVLSPQFISDPQTQGHFEFLAFTGQGAQVHALQLAGQIDPQSLMKMMTSKENLDHYTFSVATPIKTIVTPKEGNTVSGLRGIHFGLVAEALGQGTLKNSLSWTAQKVAYHITYQSFMGSLYDPPQSGDVSYKVSWTFGEVPPDLVIQRQVKDKWVNITDETVKVVVGEKVKIRGLVTPEDKDPKKGNWSVEGVKFIKRYEAHFRTGGKVIPVKNFGTQELEFFWTDGGSGQVKYSTKASGYDLSAQAQFEIKKPNYQVKIRASGESLIKNPERGVLLDQNECWGAGAHSTTNPDDLFLQSAGIQFEAVNLDIKEVAGEERWVQIITREEYSKTFDDGAKLITMLEDALDVCYPTWSGTKAADAPGIPLEIKGRRLEHNPGSHLDSTHKTQTNRLYLMFKPDGDENEWVPLKIVNWEWRGGAEWHNSTSKWGPFDCAISPAEPRAEDTSEYPEWEKNAGDDRAYKVTHR